MKEKEKESEIVVEETIVVGRQYINDLSFASILYYTKLIRNLLFKK